VAVKMVRAASLRTRPQISSTGGALSRNLSAAHDGTLSSFGLKMQITNPPDEKSFQNIVLAVQEERISRYFPAAKKDKIVAFRYYLWNCTLCESFHLPLHFSEIVCRNAFHQGLLRRIGNDWYKNTVLLGLLDKRFVDELCGAVGAEASQHGGAITGHHVVSALTFGFWEHLTTKRFDRFLWAKGVQEIFPCAPKGTTREDLHTLIESVRRWRNRIAHHRAIFDKGPMRKYQDTLALIKWVCGDTAAWVAASSKVPIAIALRPKQ
jgi:hypothetical protein